jgi:hypothetical protein
MSKTIGHVGMATLARREFAQKMSRFNRHIQSKAFGVFKLCVINGDNVLLFGNDRIPLAKAESLFAVHGLKTLVRNGRLHFAADTK